MYILFKWLINALVLLGIAYLVPGIEVKSFYTALILALLLGLVNVFLRPLLIVLTLPLNILTLGLFTFFINAFLFWLLSTVVKGFDVANFWAAFLGALLITLVSWLLNQLIRDNNPHG